MSQTLWILEENQDSDSCDHTFVLHELDKVDAYCKVGGYHPLSYYIDESIMAEDFGIDIPAKYFDALEIVELFEYLIGFGSVEVREEIADILTKAKQSHARGAKVRLAMVA